MFGRTRKLVFIAFILLAALLVWRAFYYHAPASQKATTVQPTAPVMAPTQQALQQSDLILDLFNPSEATLNNQRTQSELVRQIEEAMTVSFVLRRCDMLSDEQYYDTYRALFLYIQRTHLSDDANAELKRITASASASYSLIYSRTSCDLPQLKTSVAQLKQWRESMLPH